jgi:hypothetical protein
MRIAHVYGDESIALSTGTTPARSEHLCGVSSQELCGLSPELPQLTPLYAGTFAVTC